MYRIYIFNKQMDIVIMEDTLQDEEAARRRGQYLVEYHDLYTYAVGRIN